MTKLILPFLLCGLQLHAESKAGKIWKWSLVALTSAAFADIASSIGQYEANPIVRRTNGLFSVRKGAALKIGVIGSMILSQHYMLKKHKVEKPFAVTNLAVSGFWTGAAIRNWKIK